MAGTLQIGGVDLATHDTGTGEVTVKGNVVVPDGGTIGSASSAGALTIDASGDIQLANSLTAGTLGSGVTFPAGSAIQVKQYEVQEHNAITTSYVNYWENSITLKSSSSDVILLVNFTFLLATAGGLGVEIYRNNSATVTTAHTSVWNKNLSSATGPFTFYGAYRGSGSFFAKDSLSGFSSGDTLYYGLFARKYDANTVHMPDSSTNNGSMSMVLMEIQK